MRVSNLVWTMFIGLNLLLWGSLSAADITTDADCKSLDRKIGRKCAKCIKGGGTYYKDSGDGKYKCDGTSHHGTSTGKTRQGANKSNSRGGSVGKSGQNGKSGQQGNSRGGSVGKSGQNGKSGQQGNSRGGSVGKSGQNVKSGQQGNSRGGSVGKK